MFLRSVELRHYFVNLTFGMLTLCNLFVLCCSNSLHSFIVILCIKVVHTLKMCSFCFCAYVIFFIIFLGVLNLDIIWQRRSRSDILFMISLKKVSKGAKIRNRYNQVPHLTQDTNGKVTNSSPNIIKEWDVQ